MAVGEVDELNGFDSEGFIAVSHSRRDENFPGLEATSKNCVYGTEGRGVAAEVVEKDLHHARDWRPKIALLGVVMDSLYGAGISQGQRDLYLALLIGNHFRGQALAEAGKLAKKAAVVWINLQCLDQYAFDQVRRIGFGDNFAERFCSAACDGHFDAIAGSEGNDTGSEIGWYRYVGSHKISSPYPIESWNGSGVKG